MAQILVRNLDDDVKAALQRRAKRHGRSTVEEVRDILRDAVKEDDRPRDNFALRFSACFAGLGFEGEIPELRGQPARPAEFKE